MAHRPYPNRARALRHLRWAQAVYRYGRCPQRYVLGVSTAAASHDGGA
jgi:hypothetical protein